MAKSALGMELLDIVKKGENLGSKEFVDSLNPIVLQVETSDRYNTKSRLKIFDLLSILSNCDVKQRRKIAKKAAKLL
jgi:hypothetical protein